MRFLNPKQFALEIEESLGRPPGELDLSGYLGVEYPCVCGMLHTLDDPKYVVREMRGDLVRIVIACPILGQEALTLVHLRAKFRTRALSEAGCRSDG